MTASPSPAPRFYYADPLAAAWMAKHFGMRFCDGLGTPVHRHVETSGKYWFVPHERQYAEYYGFFYIHPDSLHLLEAQPRDICIMALGGAMVALEFYDGTEPEAVEKIIERKGLSFMWPEREAC